MKEMDRVQLIQRVSAKNIILMTGMIGTIVFTYDGSAYEVEFDGIDDVFHVPEHALKLIHPL